MSHVVSITPAGPVTLAPGGTQDFDVSVTGVPGDDHFHFDAVGSDGLAARVDITIDRDDLAGVTTGTPTASQVKGTADSGTVAYLGSPSPGVARFRYTAP